MLSFFRINDPYRLVFILIALLLMRMTIFFGDFPLHLVALKWMVIGEKLANGSYLYLEVWDNMAPFSAFVFQLMDSIFGRSLTANLIFSTLLVFFQAFLFNNLMLKHRAFNENTYLPGFLYAVVMSMFHGFYLFSPILMGLTFVLLSLDLIIAHLGENKSDQMIMLTGIYLGLANLFYYPSFMFVMVIFLAYVLLTGTPIRQHLLLVFGYILPILFTWVFYYFLGAMKEFYVNFIASMFNVSAINYVDPSFYFIVFGIPIAFISWAILKSFQSSRYNNQQERIQKLFFILLLGALCCWFLNKDRAPFQIVIILLPATFFLTHYFLNIKVRWKAELTFTIFMVSLVFINISTYTKAGFLTRMVDLNGLEIKPTKWDQYTNGKKVLYLGNDLSIYKNASLATPYFKWDLSKFHLGAAEYYDNLTAIYNNFQNDLPEVIIDEKGVMTDILEKMPTIQRKYEMNREANLFILKQEFQTSN